MISLECMLSFGDHHVTKFRKENKVRVVNVTFASSGCATPAVLRPREAPRHPPIKKSPPCYHFFCGKTLVVPEKFGWKKS